MNIEMNRIRITASLVILAALMIVVTSATALAEDSGDRLELSNVVSMGRAVLAVRRWCEADLPTVHSAGVSARSLLPGNVQ